MLWNSMYLWDTLIRVLHVHWIFLSMSNTLMIVWTKIIQPMVFTMYLNEGVTFLLGFVKVTQYLYKFQKIWYEAQIISRIPRTGYYTFIEYFVLWTWIQHALSGLNWIGVPYCFDYPFGLQYPHCKKHSLSCNTFI